MFFSSSTSPLPEKTEFTISTGLSWQYAPLPALETTVQLRMRTVWLIAQSLTTATNGRPPLFATSELAKTRVPAVS